MRIAECCYCHEVKPVQTPNLGLAIVPLRPYCREYGQELNHWLLLGRLKERSFESTDIFGQVQW